ncbi:glycerol-3-phosphate responsive antiterminator [Clostridium tyrobutyricum]|jgi:glycerol uptake operon antiterminator|uniref:glycerol-3-phosphate responsive antiterminator n=1 Tax=Clostridium tyrobutyricum TaxID=1519 RepID=UPI00057C74BC|nr:glycerol-3-phosphate responsive antiterminator [Clostridium tyrobutyricum]MBV4416091.1 glycerol-3-phosphate responsive antiterminator [Clostridium tyrobutyricum]MBV4421954.1 glycerol-3-phosphate responsive antiterminator [Clostridium tyrobutyricum]MBV4424202.1 glycerol-3-phosphate responsive antiterminator [Clostridium tyrobutyricum]MBV4428360.1 glycerol-3-phosphate responsive antiterminator [Clostridium tyrobutyricum]MBV4430619.1 glycerol-3-phosphate responsive antiterminator [Clostridium 
MNKLKEVLIENPVIAAIRNDEGLKRVVSSNANIVFILYGDILSVRDICSKLKEKGKLVFVHLDLIDGIRGDQSSVRFIKENVKADGIISTRSSNIKYANQINLFSIQRMFAIDSLSLKTGIKSIHDTNPTAVEVMPGVASKIINVLKKEIKVPIIAGGLITNKKDVIESLSAGAVAVSTTDSSLWNL